MNKNSASTTSSKTTNRRPASGDFFKFEPSKLYLQNGTVFTGEAPAWQTEEYLGEVVFNTGMTGYVESVTDPSYSNQILVFTYPLIGNYGVNIPSSESDRIQTKGIIVSEAALNWSHSGSDRSLLEWFASQNVPILVGVDTRSLTKHLRQKGTMIGAISAKRKPKFAEIPHRFVSIDRPRTYNAKHKKKVILVDCGAKENILRSLLKMPVRIKRVPYDYDYSNEEYDGVLISNGPGNPTAYQATIDIARKALKNDKPVFGICLGSQLMALAAGAKTYRLKFGHRGHNQPCITGDGKGYITSQNHGYAIDEKSVPEGWSVLFRNLNDDSVEGIEHKTKPFFSVQFHPEACPGPTDTSWLFERFYKSL